MIHEDTFFEMYTSPGSYSPLLHTIEGPSLNTLRLGGLALFSVVREVRTPAKRLARLHRGLPLASGPAFLPGLTAFPAALEARKVPFRRDSVGGFRTL